jgi:hypothetical protein
MAQDKVQGWNLVNTAKRNILSSIKDRKSEEQLHDHHLLYGYAAQS